MLIGLVAAKGAALVSRHAGRGAGTVIAGHVLARIAPGALSAIAQRLPQGALLVSGTNGKTTTARMIAEMAARAGLRPIHNRAGANLTSGVLSALVDGTDLLGRPTARLAVLEVDEAHVPEVVKLVRPRLLVLTNLFRDQLDRYGEVAHVVQAWREAITHLPTASTLVLNADDPALASLGVAARCRILLYGIEDRSVGSRTLSHQADLRLCPGCGRELAYAWVYYAHLGVYRCLGCGWARPQPSIVLDRVHAKGHGLQLRLQDNGSTLEVDLPLPGLYNAYNALAAFAAAAAVELPRSACGDALTGFPGVFGRMERVAVGAGWLVLTLVKNPVGFNQALAATEDRFAAGGNAGDPPGLVLFAINDLLADGTDVSWLWDVDFEFTVTAHGFRALCSGLRAHDMALRLKYSGMGEGRIEIDPDLDGALRQACDRALDGDTVPIFATYTAMLALRRTLQARGLVAPLWED